MEAWRAPAPLKHRHHRGGDIFRRVCSLDQHKHMQTSPSLSNHRVLHINRWQGAAPCGAKEAWGKVGLCRAPVDQGKCHEGSSVQVPADEGSPLLQDREQLAAAAVHSEAGGFQGLPSESPHQVLELSTKPPVQMSSYESWLSSLKMVDAFTKGSPFYNPDSPTLISTSSLS